MSTAPNLAVAWAAADSTWYSSAASQRERGRARVRFDHPSGLLDFGLGPGHDHDIRAFASEGHADRPSETSAAAGYQGGLTGQLVAVRVAWFSVLQSRSSEILDATNRNIWSLRRASR